MRTNHIVFFLLLIFIGSIQSCEYTEGCQYKKTRNMSISLKNDCAQKNLVEWGSFPHFPDQPELGHERIFRFWFKKAVKSDWGVDDICTKTPFAAQLKINYDPDALSGVDDTKYKVLCFYPSVPPSKKILRAEGNFAKADKDPSKAELSTLVLALPSASKEFTEVSWIEFGIEVSFTAFGDPAGDPTEDIAADLNFFRDNHQYIYLDVEYIYN